MVPGIAEDVPDSIALSRAARLTSAFYAWEQRGRGWLLWDYPVEIEPPFRPFELVPEATVLPVDDGRKPTLIGGWLERLLGRRPTEFEEPPEDEWEEPEPRRPAPVSEIIEIQLALAPDVKVRPDLAEHFLLSLSTCNAPVSFEVLGTAEAIAIQVACAKSDAAHVQEQLRSHFPDAVVSATSGVLEGAWKATMNDGVVVDFGLSDEFMRPLRTFTSFDVDPLIAMTGALADLEAGEVGVLQVLFQPVRSPWSEHVISSVTDWQGGAFFADAPDLLPLAKQKVARPLFAAVIRLAAKSPRKERAWPIVKRMGGSLAQLANPPSNELIALSNDDYPDEVHELAVVRRHTYRSGAILNSEELAALVHPPSSAVRTSRLARGHRRTKAAPKALVGHELIIGENSHAGATAHVSLTTEHRLRHTHLVGASGTGKSTLLLNMLLQDMERGHGLALIDPHGDLVEQVLSRVPEKRIDDVILVDPADVERPVGFNILSAHSDLEKTLLSSDLVAVFRRLSTSWGDQMTSVLSNAVLAFLESDRGGTLADLRRFLIEPDYRKEFLESVQDQEVVYYWQKEFPLLSGRPQAPLLTRLDTFLRPKLVRGMMVQPTNRLDFTSIMNEGKILLVRLAQGAIGEENAALLGTLFVAKIHQLALGRQSIAEADRRPFYVYLDEFQHFVTPSMATLLTGARKYGVGLVLAHQELRQLWNQERDVAGAVLANAATRICFRVGDDDAKKLEDGFTTFTARDLQNLGVGQAVCRVERAEWDFSLTTRQLPALDSGRATELRNEVVQRSRERYGAAPPARATQPAAESAPEATLRVEVQTTKPAGAPSVPPATPAFDLPVAAAGRGGAQHKYLQELVRRWADANGWKATVEQQALDGLGSVDVALENGAIRVAVEISVSSTMDYEVRNLQKCLAAGFDQVVAVVVERRSLQKLKKLLADELPDASNRIQVLNPEELFQFLGAMSEASPPTERTSRGYKVRVTRSRGGARPSSSRAIAKTLVGALKRLR